MPTCWLDYFLFWTDRLELYIPGVSLLSGFWLRKIFSPSVQLSFAVQKLFSLVKSHLSFPTSISFSRCPCLCLWVGRISLMFSFSCFKVLGLWSIFLNWCFHRVGDVAEVSLFCVSVSNFLTSVCWKDFSPMYAFGTSVNIRWLQCGPASGTFILLH